MTGSGSNSMLQYDLYDGQVPLVGGEFKVDTPIDATSAEEPTLEEVKKFVEKNNIACYSINYFRWKRSNNTIKRQYIIRNR